VKDQQKQPGTFVSVLTGAGVAGLAVVAVLLLALGIGLVGVYGFGWFTDATVNRQGQTQKELQVEGNGSYRIAAYNHFFDLCAAVQTDEQSIANLESELKTTTDSTRKAVLPASITALRNKRADDINTYNADSHKTYTLHQFKASDLPFQIDPTQELTTCHA
jgi:uncharacterized protein HemX